MEAKDHWGKTAREVFDRRPEISIKLALAFENLLDIANAMESRNRLSTQQEPESTTVSGNSILCKRNTIGPDEEIVDGTSDNENSVGGDVLEIYDNAEEYPEW